jgi:hypothetical protein
VAAAVVAVAGSSAFSVAAGHSGASPAASVKWTRISANTGQGIASAGLLRTPDARLHVVWQSNDHAKGFSLHYSTLGAKAKLINTGAVLSKWSSLTSYPRLVPGPKGGIRLVFTGANGVPNNPFNNDSMYSATSGAAGVSWALTTGSMSHSTLVPLTDDAAANESDGTPVAGWSAGVNLDYRAGVDPQSPAPGNDQSVSTGGGGFVVGPTMVRDKSGKIWAAWFDNSFHADQGYYVDQILPSAKTRVKAPGSGGKTANNQPLEAVAFTARVGGGLYLAYCVPTKTVECAHVALWRDGATKARVVPGSATGHASHVAIAAGPAGHLWIGWYDTAMNKIRLVRTNSAATGFGSVKTISAPPSDIEFDGLQLEGSKGPLDVIALTLQDKTGITAFWATELAS